MPSERVQRQIERLLDQAEAALALRDWAAVRAAAEDALRLDPGNQDALAFSEAANREPVGTPAATSVGADAELTPDRSAKAPPLPTSFAKGRYTVQKFLGEGGKKRVYLAHDTSLDRDVAFALIKTEGLDAAGRQRVIREAQAMGKLGDHPNIVAVHDIGEEAGQPYIVSQFIAGGDVEGLIEKAEDHKLPLARALAITEQVCRGLEFAHSKGIVHRDLKPGNVWLTIDGTAKIGDFGLA